MPVVKSIYIHLISGQSWTCLKKPTSINQYSTSVFLYNILLGCLAPLAAMVIPGSQYSIEF